MLVMVFPRVSSIVLNIVRIDTLGSIMVGRDGTPYSLIRIKIKF